MRANGLLQAVAISFIPPSGADPLVTPPNSRFGKSQSVRVREMRRGRSPLLHRSRGLAEHPDRIPVAPPPRRRKAARRGMEPTSEVAPLSSGAAPTPMPIRLDLRRHDELREVVHLRHATPCPARP